MRRLGPAQIDYDLDQISVDLPDGIELTYR